MSRILILDDRPINRQFLATLLQYRGYETREVSSGFEGLEVAWRWLPDLAIVDLSMPEMNGIEFVKRLREQSGSADVAIIFYTASYDIPDVERMAQESGVAYVMLKPSEPQVILEMVQKALRSAKPKRIHIETASEVERLEIDALRTSALIDFQFELAAQRHRGDVLKILSRSAFVIVPSRAAVVTVLEDDETLEFISGTAAPPALAAQDLRRLIEHASPLCSDGGGGTLGVPIHTRNERYGWLRLSQRQGAPRYSLDDERIALTLAAQTATAYENLLLYDKLRYEASLLDRNANLLRATIEASDDGILVVGRDGRIVTCNQQYADLCGIPDEVLRIGDAESAQREALKNVRNPENARAKFASLTDDGEVTFACELLDGRILECNGAPRRFDGQVIGQVWSFRDVTQRLNAEKALRDSEEKYRSLIAHIPDAVWTRDESGTVTFVSENVEPMTGYTPAEIRADTNACWIQRIHPEDRDNVMGNFADLLAGKRTFDSEYRMQRRDGRWIWMHGWSVATYERNGVLYADGVLHDITRRKQSEAQLRSLARDRELLLDSTGDGIYAVDTEGRCTMANRTAAMLLGCTIDELIGKRIHDIIHHHRADESAYPSAECAADRVMGTGQAARVTDEVFWRRDGVAIPVEYIASPLIDEGVIRGAVVTFSDVTERRRLEKRLEQASRVSSLGRMAATIAHEFNNVLMGIQPFAEILRRRAEDPKAQQAATQILNSVTRGKNITQDILRVTRPPDPIVQSFDVAEWLEELAIEIRAQVGPNVIVKVDAPDRGTLFALCDPAQMQQVVMNLALNARDAMNSNGTLTLCAARADAIRLEIIDTGCGIPPETLPFVFEPLFTTKKSGTGLGLAVAQQLVVRNSGTISVESEPGKGTRFQIELPLTTGVHSSPTNRAELSPMQFGVRRVVIVEDDSLVAAGLAAILAAESVAVRVVNTGGEAFEAVKAFDPDVVLIDISLPDVDGTVVYEEIVERWPEKPVIFSTGHADEGRLPQVGAKHVGFLRKPYSTEALIAKLREVV